MANIKLKNQEGIETTYSGVTNITVKDTNDNNVSFIIPSGNQDITNLDEYDVTNKATARVSATERAKIIAENIKKDVSILGVTGSFEGGGSVSTQSQSIFTGWTAPLTYLNSPDNVFEYKSATHNITITGLDNIATISGNGTKNVTVTIDTTSTSDRQTAFTITCSNDSQSLTYNGIAFHYGTDVTNGNCLVVAQTLINEQIGYIFIESSSLPCFSHAYVSLWNNIYYHQIISFIFAKYSVTSISSDFLSNCYTFNQPITIPSNVTSIGSYFLYNCCSFNQPITIPSNVTSISNFLSNCYTFNQPITIPSNVTSISNFLSECYSFNQPITIPSNVTSIGNYFLNKCYSFNQPITIPNNVTSIGNYFLSECYSFIYLEYNASIYPSDNNSLSQKMNSKTSESGTGIYVTGSGASGLKAALPNRTSSPLRKLV